MNDSAKNKVREQFGRNAAHYVTSPLHAKGDDLALLVSECPADGAAIALDIATGGGHVANAIAPLVKRVTAYDLTEEMLKTAAAFIRGNGHANVDYVIGDAEKMPFADETFDLATCRIAAHHFPDVPAFAAEALRILKPGGMLLLIDNIAPEEEALDRFYNRIEKERDPSHIRAWRKSEWISLLERTGFRIEKMVVFPKTFVFADWCERAGLSDDLRDRLQDSILAAPKELREFFAVRTEESGKLQSFRGASAYFRAVKPGLD
jgi:ubiquinone/menaquinone biosynthesis C-methylase UbiE